MLSGMRRIQAAPIGSCVDAVIPSTRNAYSKNDRARNIGSGSSDIEAGLRLRYEIKRQFAPYIGVSWKRKFGNTAAFARAANEEVRESKFVAGVRIWF